MRMPPLDRNGSELTELAKLYRERATALGRDAADAEAHPERESYHAGAERGRITAGDWSALAALVEFAAPYATGATDTVLATGAQRLANRLEGHHG